MLELRERRADTRTLAAVHLCAYYWKTFDTFCFYPRHGDSAPTRGFLATSGTEKHTDMHQRTFMCRTRAKIRTVIPAFLSKKKSKQTSYTLNYFKLTPIYCSVSVFLPNLLLTISLLKTASEQTCQILWNTKHAVYFVHCQTHVHTRVLTLFLLYTSLYLFGDFDRHGIRLLPEPQPSQLSPWP